MVLRLRRDDFWTRCTAAALRAVQFLIATEQLMPSCPAATGCPGCPGCLECAAVATEVRHHLAAVTGPSRNP